MPLRLECSKWSLSYNIGTINATRDKAGERQLDTFTGSDDDAGDDLVDELILFIDVDDGDGVGRRRRTAATKTSIVVYL